MATGGVFVLIANDGKADRMIMASGLLQQRIRDVVCARARAGKADTTPTLVDLERTHVLFVNAHFKPFAAIGFEYSKTRPSSGNPVLGGGVNFSIPQFGDFFHDMVCRTRLSSFTGNTGLTPVQGSTAFPASTSTVFYNLVDAFGNVLVPSGATNQVTYKNLVRYCEYPGNRLFDQVKFDVNGNPLDQYDSMVPTMLQKFCTSPNKQIGQDRLVGQEVPLTGYGPLCAASVTDADTANTPAGISRAQASQSNQSVALFGSAVLTTTPAAQPTTATPIGAAAVATLNAAPAAQFDISRKVIQVANGPQTPKPVQPALEIWNKLRFWFNDDVRLAIPSVSIPFGQRFITIELAAQGLLAYEFPSLYLQKIDVDPAEPLGSAATLRRVTHTPIFQRFGVTDIAVEKMELYINNIFVNPEIHDIYIKRIGFSLIRVYRCQTARCNQDAADEKLLSNMKWPIEYMFIGLRPVWNIKDISVGTGGLVTGGNQNQWRDWHRLTRMVDAQSDVTSRAETSLSGAAAAIAATGSNIGQVIPDQYWLPVPTVDSLSLTSHGITIFDAFSDTFFNQYMPNHYGGAAITTPEDPGALFMNMSLYPRGYQPAGHLNVSRARETYIKFTSSYVSARTPADLIVVGVAINFLLITDGSAVLRYST